MGDSSEDPIPLAAYGTLMPGCGGIEHLGLEDEVEPIGPCLVPGQIWLRPSSEDPSTVDPGLVAGPGYSHAYLLSVSPSAWPVLDAWEDPGQYVREQTETREGRRAWVYRYVDDDVVTFLRDRSWVRYAMHPRSRACLPADPALAPEPGSGALLVGEDPV